MEAFLSNPQQLNAYAYARNNPLAYLDPDGNIAIPASLRAAYISVGDWGNRVYASNSTAAFIMDHPYVPAAVGAAPLAAYGAVAAAPSIAATVGSIAPQITAGQAIRAGAGAGLNVTNTALNAKVEGRSAPASEYLYSGLTGAAMGVAPGPWYAQGAYAGASNWTSQQLFGQGGTNWSSIGISTVAGAAGNALVNANGLAQTPQWYTSVTEQAVGWTIEAPGQVMSTGIQRSIEDKKKRK
ncbi:MAG: hypothetical protein QY323_03005 [Patescibacteria group bacterium]|nr:MAG: hypothetical protein QY323_03005 [Patescibacteria group bacterium]